MRKTQAGLGLRKPHQEAFASTSHLVDFLELAPENWMNLGGRYVKQLDAIAERYSFVCHGLSLSIGGPTPLDEKFLSEIKIFLDRYSISLYTEHLSYCSDDGHLYDLLPIPFTHEAVDYVAKRIRRVQEILERKIAIENVSYYCAPGQQLTELEFINAVLAQADCDLLLDVNNIYVNSINHRYNAQQFLKNLHPKHIAYIHVAGHHKESKDLRIDTHGADVIDPVWQLLKDAYQCFGIIPTLLERDFNLPPLNQLLQEIATIRNLQIEVLDSQELSVAIA